MKKYRRLGEKERYQIEILSLSGKGVREIAKVLKRSPSTICDELRKCPKEYGAEMAQRESQDLRRKPKRKLRVIHGRLEQQIRLLLKTYWSPEQVAERLKEQQGHAVISYRTIYRYIERDRRQGGRLKSNLRILCIQRKDRKKPQYKPAKDLLPPRKSIEERPRIVELRKRLGDYERDTLLGTRAGVCLLTIVDRVSRQVYLACMPKLNSREVHQATCRILRNLPRKTITNDNGIEFHKHPQTAKALGVDIYFSRSYRAWERGTNENTNGLLRQFFPRKKEIPLLSRRRIKFYEDLLNNRPRKCLGFKTPNEIYHQLKRQGVRLVV